MIQSRIFLKNCFSWGVGTVALCSLSKCCSNIDLYFWLFIRLLTNTGDIPPFIIKLWKIGCCWNRKWVLSLTWQTSVVELKYFLEQISFCFLTRLVEVVLFWRLLSFFFWINYHIFGVVFIIVLQLRNPFTPGGPMSILSCKICSLSPDSCHTLSQWLFLK